MHQSIKKISKSCFEIGIIYSHIFFIHILAHLKENSAILSKAHFVLQCDLKKNYFFSFYDKLMFIVKSTFHRGIGTFLQFMDPNWSRAREWPLLKLLRLLSPNSLSPLSPCVYFSPRMNIILD